MTPAERLSEWVALKHKGQLIKRTQNPYFTHLDTVATLAKPYTALGYEIGLCHDILEDTDTSPGELFSTLISLGYADTEANAIVNCVIELTDVFTVKSYPQLSKNTRKELEATRLITISPAAQTVKYADLNDNIDWMLQYDRKHLKKYLLKKQLLVSGMLAGDLNLRQKLLDKIKDAQSSLKKPADY